MLLEPETVLPNLIELPHLPSFITSPAKGIMGWILDFSTKVPPIKGLLNSIPSTVLFCWSGEPASICWYVFSCDSLSRGVNKLG